MWQKPELMNAVADLLLLVGAAALVLAGVLLTLRLPLFPLRQVVLAEAPVQVRRSEIERALALAVQGNFLSADLDAVRKALEKLPWVRRAEVRRRWPATIAVQLEEQRAAARWADGGVELVNTYGEIFPAGIATPRGEIPLFQGPPGTAADVLRHHRDFARLLAPIGRRPVETKLSARHAWQVRLDDGTLLDLGRERPGLPVGLRLGRFVAAYPEAVAGRQPRVVAVDLRYPNGFALRAAAAAGGETRGKS